LVGLIRIFRIVVGTLFSNPQSSSAFLSPLALPGFLTLIQCAEVACAAVCSALKAEGLIPWPNFDAQLNSQNHFVSEAHIRPKKKVMSALLPKADIHWSVRHVRFVPKADIYFARLRANAPTRPTNVAKDLLASNSSSRREASVVGSPNVSSGRRNASALGHTARSMS